MVRNVLFSLTALLLLGISTMTARGQDDLLAELYGEGVHLFNNGQYADAHEMFTAAIDQGNRDPRCYYFRGMTYHHLGRPEKSDADFQAGADLEASGDVPIGSVGRSLERIQGSLRLQLETYRRKARLAIRLKEAQRQKIRYEQFKRDEKRVLRGNDSAADPSSVPASSQGDSTDPFNKDGTPPQTLPDTGAKPTPKPAPKPAKPAVDDPFGDSKPAAKPTPAKPAADDPFADPFADPKPAAKPAAKPSPAKPAAGDDPFANPKPTAKPAAADPFADPKPAPAKKAADDDPFK